MRRYRIVPLITTVTLALLLLVSGASAQNEPQMPHLFYGQVSIGSIPAPAGTTVEAWCPGIQNGTPGNPVFVGENGRFGGPGSFDEKLIVSGDMAANTPIFFFVNGSRALCRETGSGSSYAESYPFKPSEQTELDLLVERQPGSAQESTGNTTAEASPITTVTTSSSTGSGGSARSGGGGSIGSAISSGTGSAGSPTSSPTSAVGTPTDRSGESAAATIRPEETGVTESVSVATSPATLPVQMESTPKKSGNEPIFFCITFVTSALLVLSMKKNA